MLLGMLNFRELNRSILENTLPYDAIYGTSPVEIVSIYNGYLAHIGAIEGARPYEICATLGILAHYHANPALYVSSNHTAFSTTLQWLWINMSIYFKRLPEDELTHLIAVYDAILRKAEAVYDDPH